MVGSYIYSQDGAATVSSLQLQCLPVTSDWLALFPNLISIQNRKQKHNCWHRIQKLTGLVGKTMPS